MSETTSPSVEKVRAALVALGLEPRIVEFSESTRTAAEAAAAIGCDVAQIVKSLIFRGKESKRGVLVIASGANRVNEKKIAELLGEPIERADANFVRQATGFAIGGVPPVAHVTPLETFLDEDLWQHSEIWAAAGTPHTVFPLTPDELSRIAHGHRAAIKQ